MKYTVAAKGSIENLVHNIKLLEDHIKLEKITEGYSDRYFQMTRLQNECYRQLGEWYYIERTI